HGPGRRRDLPRGDCRGNVPEWKGPELRRGEDRKVQSAPDRPREGRAADAAHGDLERRPREPHGGGRSARRADVRDLAEPALDAHVELAGDEIACAGFGNPPCTSW